MTNEVMTKQPTAQRHGGPGSDVFGPIPGARLWGSSFSCCSSRCSRFGGCSRRRLPTTGPLRRLWVMAERPHHSQLQAGPRPGEPAEQQAEFPNQLIHLDFIGNLLIRWCLPPWWRLDRWRPAPSLLTHLRGSTGAAGTLCSASFSRVDGATHLRRLPNFILMKELGWVYTWKGLLAPYVLMNPFALFFLRQFFLNIPQEIEEAARLDGLGRWGIFRRICLPMSRAPVSTLLTIQAVFAWNEYLWPQQITNGSHAQVLTVALSFFVLNTPGVARDWAGFMATTTLTVIPLASVFHAGVQGRLAGFEGPSRRSRTPSMAKSTHGRPAAARPWAPPGCRRGQVKGFWS